jgi:hypothetical protein
MFFKNSHEIFDKLSIFDYNFDDKLTIDKLYKVEDGINNGMKKAFKEVNLICNDNLFNVLNNKLGHRNRDHYSVYYDDELKQLVYEKDKFLIEKYGYEFEINKKI